MNQDASQWKQKYLTSLDKYEKKERAWKELEELLRLGMNRVALAAEGVDEVLDRQLRDLRKSIRSKGYKGLEYIVEDISKSVKRLDEQRREAEHADTRPAKVLLHLIESLHFPKQMKGRVKTLRNNLNQLDRDHAIDTPLRELAAIINETLQLDSSADTNVSSFRPGNLLGRIFRQPEQAPKPDKAPGTVCAQTLERLLQDLQPFITDNQQVNLLLNDLRQVNTDSDIEQLTTRVFAFIHDSVSDKRSDTTPTSQSCKDESHQANEHTPTTRSGENPPSPLSPLHQPSIGAFCLQLIEHLQLPEDFSDEVQQLRDRIVAGIELSESAVILNELADLITATRAKVEKEKQDLQDFLHQLTDRLKDIDTHLSGAESHTKSSMTSSKSLGDAVEAQMKDIETSVQDAAELNQLKQAVQDRLEAIRNHLLTYQQGEELTHRELLNELAKTNARLHDLELETEQLRARLSEEHAQAIHDKLTGIYNRLAYEERIEQEYQRWKRYKTPLVVMVLDVDHFKSINDTYGHKAGDKALKLIAQTLEKNLRETDFLARYGGEEFVVLMPETELDAAMGVADKLRQAIEAVQFNYQEQKVNITISAGATQFKKGDSAGAAFQRADQALYHAKQSGRNRCYTPDADT